MRNTENNVMTSGETGEVVPSNLLNIRAECLPDLFVAQVRRTPDRIAFHFEGAELTYSELDISSNRVARLLITHGVGPESIVGLMLPRSAELLIALLGVIKAGGAYLPLDPDYPPARLAAMLKDSGAAVVLSTSEILKRAPILDGLPSVLMDDSETRKSMEMLSGEEVTDAARRKPLQPNHLLYVIYTSGTTGTPKGVAVEHRSFTSLMRSMTSRFRLGEGDRFLTLTTICFDPAGMEIFLPLLQGATLEMLSGMDSRDPVRVVEAVISRKMAGIATIPTFLQALLISGLPRTVRLIFGGEPLSAELVPQLLQFPEAINLYGPTETTVASSFHRVCGEDAKGGRVVTIGSPLDGEQFFILDEQRQMVTDGSAGELFIAGAGLARGYLNRPDLTAEKFVPCHFLPGQRMYRTGDLAGWDENGTVSFLGRVDQQVKIRGFRVEPGEVEFALLKSVPAVKECVVVARVIRGQTHLVAYYVEAPGFDMPSVKSLRSTLSVLLPDHMVPKIYVRVEKWPLNLNGKLDRQALPQPDIDTSREAYVPPVGKTEAKICAIFRESTGAPRVSRHDDFFQIGGHSLAAVLCIHRLRREFKRDITLSQLFDAPTPKTLARSLSGDTQKPIKKDRCNSSAPTIFLLPGMGGDEPRLVRFRMEWQGIGQIVVPDYPDWAQMRDHQGDGMNFLVGEVLQQIRAISPSGPIWLMGYSMGANCAHATALELVRQGREIAFLGLLDGHAEVSIDDVLSAQIKYDATVVEEGRHLALDVGRLLQAIPRKDFTRVLALTTVRRLTSSWGRPALKLAARHRDARLPVSFGYHLHAYLNESTRLAAVEPWSRARNESPTPLSVPARLFRTVEKAIRDNDDQGWKRHFPRLEVVTLPGGHLTMFDPPHVDALHEQTSAVIRAIYDQQADEAGYGPCSPTGTAKSPLSFLDHKLGLTNDQVQPTL